MAKGEDLVDLNTADVVQLAGIPGVGRELAKAIVQRRVEHGPFRIWSDLEAVPGMDAPLVGVVRSLATIGGSTGVSAQSHEQEATAGRSHLPRR